MMTRVALACRRVRSVIPQKVMRYAQVATLAQIRAQGHLSASGTIVTPVTTFAATFPPFPCWMTQ